MNQAEDQLYLQLQSNPENWKARLALLEFLAAHGGGGDAVVAWIDQAPNAPDTEEEMRRVVELANGVGNELNALKRVLHLFLQEHITSSWAHYTLAQALYYTHDVVGALQHYQTSKSLNPSRSLPELDRLLGEQEAQTTPEIATGEIVNAPRTPTEPEPIPEFFEPAPLPPAETPETTWVDESVPPAHPETEEDPAPDPDPTSEETAPPAPGEEAFDESTSVESESPSEEPSPSAKEGKKHEHAPTVAIAEIDADLIKAAEKEDDTRQKLSAFSIAIGFHLILLSFLAFFQVFAPRPGVPTFVTSVPEKITDPLTRPEPKKFKPSPKDTVSTNIAVRPVDMAMKKPEKLDKPVNTLDPVSSGDLFGSSMSFAAKDTGSSVSFFGSKTYAQRVIFVVDFSTSMYGPKDALMRKELVKSLVALPNEVEYALIFFAGPAWFAGQYPPADSSRQPGGYGMVIQGGGNYLWYEGWSEKERHFGERRTSLFHYSGGERSLPRGRYAKATRDNLRHSIAQVRATPLVFGTDWRWPLKMAMMMEPDTIYFMTDGTFKVGRDTTRAQMIDDLLAFNRRHGNAKINTVCMKILMARKELEQLAKGSRGEFTLVRDDGSTVSGSALDKAF